MQEFDEARDCRAEHAVFAMRCIYTLSLYLCDVSQCICTLSACIYTAKDAAIGQGVAGRDAHGLPVNIAGDASWLSTGQQSLKGHFAFFLKLKDGDPVTGRNAKVVFSTTKDRSLLDSVATTEGLKHPYSKGLVPDKVTKDMDASAVREIEAFNAIHQVRF